MHHLSRCCGERKAAGLIDNECPAVSLAPSLKTHA